MTRKRILVVDDEVNFARLVKMFLENAGPFEVHNECLGKGVLVAARDFKPDMILMDICLPDANGKDVAERIHADPEFKDIPILFMSGQIDLSPEADNNIAPAVRPFLPKPANPWRLMDCIQKCLGFTTPAIHDFYPVAV